MTRTIRLIACAAVVLAMAAPQLQAQFPVATPSASIRPTALSRAVAAAAPGESFSLLLSSTVQSGALTIRDSTAGTSQTYGGSVVLTPTWDLNNNRQITIYAYLTQPFTSSATTLVSTTLEASAIGGSGSANGIWTSFGSTVDGHAAAVTLTQVLAHGANKTVTDASERITVSLRLNTTTLYVQPGLYTGIVTFGALVQ